MAEFNGVQIATHTVSNAVQFRVAYEDTQGERAALLERDVLTIHFEVTSAVHIAIGALERLAQLRPEMSSLPVNLALIDRLAHYAYAAAYAHALWVISKEAPPEQRAVYEAALAARVRLRSDANNLALYSIINAEVLAELKGDAGHRNVGYDILSLVALHREAQGRSVGRTAIHTETLEEYEALASRLLNVVAKRETQLKGQAEVADQRRRSATLLVKAYDQVQRAVTFIRWEQKDADKITPSLYAAKGAGRRPKARPKAEEPAEAVGESLLPADSLPALSSLVSQGALPPSAPAGMRGGSPFI